MSNTIEDSLTLLDESYIKQMADLLRNELQH